MIEEMIEKEVESFDAQYAAWLDSPKGRFAVFTAERTPGKLVHLHEVRIDPVYRPS